MNQSEHPGWVEDESWDQQHPFDQLLQVDADPVKSGVLLKRLADQADAASMRPDPSRGPWSSQARPDAGTVVLSGDAGQSDDVDAQTEDDPSPMMASAWIDDLAQRHLQLVDADPAILGGLLRLIHVHALKHGSAAASTVNVDAVRRIALAISPDAPNRHLLLHLLASIGTQTSLSTMIELLMQSPPRGWMAAAQILSPLMQKTQWPIEAVYPAILDCLGEPALASSVLDLTGHLFRSGRVNRHLAHERLPALNHLLSGVADRLGRFEDNPRSFGDEVDQVQAVLGEAVALATSLCDAVGLIGDEASIAPLNKALKLKHRRVQCEAAGALARLGDPEGQRHLLELVNEPSARLRAIAYADELGCGDQVDEAARTPGAIAEAEMSLWLSQPQQMGVPPTSVEVIDSRRMLWPSFDDPVDVHLVRFEYNFGERVYSNVGMTGPAVYAFATDVADLPTDDIYAMYAGWHAEHDDIFSVAAADLNHVQTRAMEPMADHLLRSGYDELKPTMMGFFLDETASVFEATRDGTRCVVITDGLEIMDLPTQGRSRPATSEDVFQLYKGRKMLRTFNPQDNAFR